MTSNDCHSRTRALTLAAIALLSVSGTVASSQSRARTQEKFRVEEATIADIQKAIESRQITTVDLVKLYLARIKAYNGTCVSQPQGVLGPITPIAHAGQLNALGTLNLRPAARKAWGFDDRKARSMTDLKDDNPAMPDALEVAAAQDQRIRADGPACRSAPRCRHLNQGSVRHRRHADDEWRRCGLRERQAAG